MCSRTHMVDLVSLKLYSKATRYLIRPYSCYSCAAINKTSLFLVEISVQIINKGLANLLQGLFALSCLSRVQLLRQAQILTAYSSQFSQVQFAR